ECQIHHTSISFAKLSYKSCRRSVPPRHAGTLGCPSRLLIVAGISFTPLIAAPDLVPNPHHLVSRLAEIAILLDIDGTLLDCAPTPREVSVPPGLLQTLNDLFASTRGALALVSGRSLRDIDRLFAPARFPAVAGHGAEIRASAASDAVAIHAEPLEAEL